MTVSLSQIAFRNIRLHWRQSLAALASISAGFISLSLFQGYMTGVGETYEEVYQQRGMLGSFLIERTGARTVGMDEAFRFALTVEDQAIIDEFLGIKKTLVSERVRFLEVSGMVAGGKSNAIFSGFGYDTDSGGEMRRPTWEWNTLAGVPLEKQSKEDAFVVGQSLGEIIGCRRVGSPRYLNGKGGYLPVDRPFTCDGETVQVSVTTYSGQLNAVDAPVVGIMDAVFKELDTKYLVMPLSTAQKLLNTRSVSFYSVRLKSSHDISGMISELKRYASERGLPIEVRSWKTHPLGDMYGRTMNFLGIFRDFVVAVILAIVALSILNTFLKRVTERTREIGMLRSLGFLRAQIVTLFVTEAAVLAAFGSAIGLGASIGLTAFVNALGVTYKAGMLSEPVPFRIAFDWPVYGLSFLCLFLIAVVTAFFSVMGVVRRRIAESLVHV